MGTECGQPLNRPQGNAPRSPARRLPEGTVTFLFTDIEGSTKLLHRLGEKYVHVLSRHRELMRDAFDRSGGCEIDTQGDAFFVAFRSALGAVGAAVESQRSLRDEAWPDDEKLLVRMGIHTGKPIVVDDNYVGMDVHRAARICSAAHGAQVVISEDTHTHLGDAHSFGFKDLGLHRLKDIEEPEHILQIVADDLPSEFPQLRSLAPQTNVPRHVASLVGRERELRDLHSLLLDDDVRLLTVTGPGGTGKTRVAGAAALNALNLFTEGVFFVDLTEVTTSDVIATTIGETLGVAPTDDPSHGLRVHIGNKKMLLLLDNFEQAVSAADVVARLLQGCPQLKVLITSRTILSLNGEREYPLPPLALPEERTREGVMSSEAGLLFVRRASAAKPTFELTDANAPAVAEICDVLDGLPLALELAAARLKIFPLDALVSRLGDRLKLLTGGSSDAPPRHRTLRGTIEWSYDLLDPAERDFFRALAVFSGGATLEAIEEIIPPELDPIDALTSLVNHSLVRQHELSDGGFRFDMLQTIREYAAGLLDEAPGRDTLRTAHARYYLALLRHARSTKLDRDPEFVARDLDNFRATLAWFGGRADEGSIDDAEALLELAGLLGRYWYTHGMVAEGSGWLERALAHAPPNPSPTRALALRQLGVLKELHRHVDEAAALFDQALKDYRRLGDELGEAACLNSIGVVIMARGDLEAPEDLYLRSADIRRKHGDDQTVASISNLGILYLHRKDYGRAVELLEEALELDRKAGDDWGVAVTQNNLASAYLDHGDTARSRELVAAGMEACFQLEEFEALCEAFEVAAALAAVDGDLERAARLYGAAEKLRTQTGLQPTLLDGKRLEEATTKARTALTPERFDEVRHEGTLMTLEQAVNYALGRQPQRRTFPPKRH
jgi:predicted ATPase/class 3 adenylate cyclase